MQRLDRLRQLWSDNRLRAIAMTGFAVAALLFVAAGLPRLELLPGQPLPQILSETGTGGSIAGLPGGDLILFLLRAVYFAGLVCLPFFVIYLILNPKARKQFFKDLLRVLVFCLILWMGSNLLRRLGSQGEEQTMEGAGAASNLPGIGEVLQFSPQTQPWLILLVSALLALALCGLAGLALWLMLRRKPPEPPLKRIALQAQAALEAIQAGGDLRNIVIRCYAEMSRVLNDTLNIQRAAHMTPREFEAALEGRGLPPQPVRTLTRLFEEARYGTAAPGEPEERQALDSLAAIVAACGGQP
jgi:hypothetical protein